MNRKKVIAIIRGGIGNQLFTYAATKNIALRNNARLILATDWFENEPHGRHFLLDQFSITADVTSLGNTDVPYSLAHHSRAEKLGRYFYAASKTYPHYFVERAKNFLNQRVPVDRRAFTVKSGDYLFVDGFFQNEAYFREISDILRSDFSLRTPPSEATQAVATEINKSNSVCLHFRRTELEHKAMLEKHGNQMWLKGYSQGLDRDYYLKAIEIIEGKVESPRYFCFSDHPEWVKENFSLPVDLTFFSENNSQTGCHEDLYLMGLCKHHVISHSTFGWWGAWLSRNPSQIVVAPVNISSRPKPPDYPDRWVKIEVCQQKIQ